MSDLLRQERISRLHAAMSQRGMQWLMIAGDAWRSDYLFFALGITPMEGVVIACVEPGVNPQLWVQLPVEAQRLRAAYLGLQVHCVDDPVAHAEAEIARRDVSRGGLAPAHSMPTRLALSPLGSSLDDTTAMLDRLMVCKTAAEADAVERSVVLADEGYAVFREVARPGIKEFELIAELESWFRTQGCPENFMIMGSGGKEVRTMRPPGERVLQAGDLVTTELTPCRDGYYAQICRTLVLGEPTAVQLRAYDVYVEALEAGIAAVRPGATHGDVARAQNDVFRKYDLGEYVTSKYTRVRGHGMGLYVDGPHVLEDVDLVLEPNMTLVVHPNTYHPEAGYIVLGDMVRVTDDGCRVLTKTPRTLAVGGSASTPSQAFTPSQLGRS